MKHPLPESQKEVVIALYQYFQMNAEQLSILLNYNLRTIYNMISRLRKQGWVHAQVRQLTSHRRHLWISEILIG